MIWASQTFEQFLLPGEMFWTRRIVRRKMCTKGKYFLTFFLLCLPALSDQKCWQTYMHGQQTKDYRLEGFQLKALHTRTLFTCFQICLKLDTCESLNFATDSGVCELNRKRVSKSGYLIYRPGYIFVQALFEKGVSQILFFFISDVCLLMVPFQFDLLIIIACIWFVLGPLMLAVHFLFTQRLIKESKRC